MSQSPSLCRRRVLGAVSAGMLALLGARNALAKVLWPSRLVHVVVPFSPGTSMDTLARSLAPHLSALWGQTIVIDNRPGASGNLGANFVAKSQPDGHTLMVGVSTLVINPALYANMTYDPLKDLAPIGLCATGSFLLVASVASKIGSVDELVKRARARPGASDYATPGIATGPHMAMELFKLQEKISITHIPFSGAAAAVNAVLAGSVPLMFLPVHIAMPQVRGGRLAVLAVAGPRRSALAPDVPTLSELGYHSVDADLWYGMFAPSGTPREIIVKVNADMMQVLAMPEVGGALAAQGMKVAPSSPDEMAALMMRDSGRWAAVIKHAGIKAE